MQKKIRVLIADDDAADRLKIRRSLKQAGPRYEPLETATVQDALRVCEQVGVDCAIMDYRLPGQSGLAGITDLHHLYPYMAIIMLTGVGDEMVAVDAMKRGASDYLVKGKVDKQSIVQSIDRAVETANLRRLLAEQQEELHLFNSKVVHDFREPLRTIATMAHLIREGAAEPEELNNLLDMIFSAAERSQALLQALSEYTVVNGQVTFAPVALQQVVHDTLANLDSLIHEHGACITHGELPIVHGNVSLLAQLFQNLLSNAIKFCEGKTPTIEISSLPQEGDTCIIRLADNGIGIPEKWLGNIFQPFKRLHAMGRFEGTGLGLATCKKIIERHHGRIWCTSTVGEGTTFFFTLQAAQHNQTQAATADR